MLIRFFKNNKPSSFILLPLFALALRIIGFFPKQINSVNFNMPLYETMVKSLNQLPFIAALIAAIFIISEAFLLNYIVNKNEILTKPSFLPALFYIVFMSSDGALLSLHPLVFANFFVLLAINKLVSSYQKDKAFSNAFDAGIFFSISTLFYFPSIVFLPLAGIGFILFRPFNWREWIISFIGILVPYAFVFVYYFWNDLLAYWWNFNAFFPDLHEPSKSSLSKSFYLMLGISFLIILFSLGKLFVGFPEASQKNKKGILLFIWFSLFVLISAFIVPEISIQSFSPLAIPVSVFCANYFLKIKKAWWGELLFLLLIISVFINQIYYYF